MPAALPRIDPPFRLLHLAQVEQRQGLTERFYSLPRPGSGRKSTGLGLSFVQEVAELRIGNVEDGVAVRLHLPGA